VTYPFYTHSKPGVPKNFATNKRVLKSMVCQFAIPYILLLDLLLYMYVYVLLKGQQNQQVRLIIFHCFNFSGVLYFTRVFSSLQNTSNKIITALRAMHLLLAFCSDKEEIFVYFILFLFLVFTMTTRRLRSSALDAVTAAANSTALDAAASRRQTRQRSSAAATPSTSSSKIGGGRGGSHVSTLLIIGTPEETLL